MVLVARRFAFFDFNLKAEALILAALGLRTYEATSGSLLDLPR
jgi:hypothetical protein